MSKPNVAAVVAGLVRELESAASPERAEFERGYLKSSLRFRGVTLPDLRRIAKTFTSQHPDLDHATLVALVERLWQGDWHDERGLAMLIVERRLDLLRAGDIELLESCLRRSDNWAHVDLIATKLVGHLASRFTTAKRRLARWARDDNFWMRRSAMLGLLTDLRAGGGDFELFADFASRMIGEKEFFIRKAIGWVLREVSKKRPELTYDFLRRHAAECSGLTLREGSKNLTEAQRSELRKRRG